MKPKVLDLKEKGEYQDWLYNMQRESYEDLDEELQEAIEEEE